MVKSKFNIPDLKDFLDEKSYQYESLEFIKDDPILIPHSFTKKEDIEISGFITSVISWGNRKSIINSAKRIVEFMDNSPYDFILNHTDRDLYKEKDSIHRTFNSTDLNYFIVSLKKISVETFNNGKKNNDFLINFGKTLEIKGNQLDAKNIPKFLNQKSDNNFLSNLNKDITINLSKIDAPMKEKLKDFSLIGRIEKGKFVKIISKGDFGGGNFIDISMIKIKMI